MDANSKYMRKCEERRVALDCRRYAISAALDLARVAPMTAKTTKDLVGNAKAIETYLKGNTK